MGGAQRLKSVYDARSRKKRAALVAGIGIEKLIPFVTGTFVRSAQPLESLSTQFAWATQVEKLADQSRAMPRVPLVYRLAASFSYSRRLADGFENK